ncbi:Fic family protein (plasmid) [Deefgea piscis]|uniref:Fic family protein n=1 Tax=Deefgea piscis TaxID=2739061 RepID=A0A6M8T0N6_9NEIS|nr:Fic family protein [Deefgea piscis]QKJ68249.1 Fic family protein [Deefgea piscis]
MGRPQLSEQDKLARALKELHAVTGSDKGVVKGNQLKPASRKLLVDKAFLREVIKGWYFVSDPHADDGDTTPFFANFWEYLAKYLAERFGTEYCLSPADSLKLHTQCNVIPQQVTIHLGTNQTHNQELAHGYSLAMYPSGALPTTDQVTFVQGLRCLKPEICLVKLPPNGYKSWAEETQLLLATLNDPDAVAALYTTNASGVGRIAGAMRAMGRVAFADNIVRQLTGLNYKLVETNPYEHSVAYQLGSPNASPLYARVKLQWEKQRARVLQCKPADCITQLPFEDYLARIEAIKVQDAYHSLSIERYRVTPELIAKVERGDWSPDLNPTDRQQVDAMAARGYLDAFNGVKASISDLLATQANAGQLFTDTHQRWYQQLFKPSVDAGILQTSDLIGYRRSMVFLRGSLHSPPHYDHVRDGMAALKECLLAEEDAFVRAVLGHWLFGFIHPYMDGNGRLARFTMNLMLASGQYPWTVIKVDHRQEYMAALEAASVEQDITPFAKFIARCVSDSYSAFT